MTDDKTKRPKAEILADLKRELELDEDEKELEGKSDEEIMELFEREGGDRKEMEAFLAKQAEEVRKMIGEATQPEPKPAEVIDLATHRRRLVRWAATGGLAGMVAMAAGIAIYLNASTGELSDSGVYAAEDAAGERPGDHERAEAFDKCADAQYGYCLMWLDMAQKKDPGSNSLPTVIMARKLARAELAKADGGK